MAMVSNNNFIEKIDNNKDFYMYTFHTRPNIARYNFELLFSP